MTPRADKHSAIDELLAAVLRGEVPNWPVDWMDRRTAGLVVDRAIYHGIAGLLIEQRDSLARWPDGVIVPIMEQARAQAIWEMRHRIVISNLLTSLQSQGVAAVLLKGTALAYDLYTNPATRARADTDLLIEQASLKIARQLFLANGFEKVSVGNSPFGETELQEEWQYVSGDGTHHHVDLHWQTMNSPALEGLLSFADCTADPLDLPRLCPAASTMNHGAMLLHLCLHRAAHAASPYYTDGAAYFGGDRLIWAQDIHLVAGTLSVGGWAGFCQLAESGGVAGLCVD